MQASYKQLITEHEAIEAAANALLARLDKGYASTADLAVQLKRSQLLSKTMSSARI
jgi:hypothetical protein